MCFLVIREECRSGCDTGTSWAHRKGKARSPTSLSSAPCANSTIAAISPSSWEAAASLAWLDQHALDQRALTPNRERRVRVHEPKLLKATNEASMG